MTSTIPTYLAALPDDRRLALEALRKLILDNLDPAYTEGITYGMLSYFVPHSVYPPGYHVDPKQPLPFLSLASQKNHMALYLMGLYVGPPTEPGGEETADTKWFRGAWQASGKKLDMGKACLRFKKLDDLALDVLAEAIRRIPAQEFIRRYEATRGAPKKKASRPT